MRVLVVKMSSLGDVVHTLPGVTDAAAAFGGTVTFDWVVEEAFAAIPRRHPAVADVLPIAWRRWRRDLWHSRRELGAFRRLLRENRYDVVLDAQGLIKSALVSVAARAGVRAGLDRASAREPLAAICYGRRVAVPRPLHAVDRIRRLFAGALGYPAPDGAIDYGLAGEPVGASPAAPATVDSAGSRRPRCLLLHGTTWPSKHWPQRFWADLAQRAVADGFDVAVPWGDAAEQQRADVIARSGGARVMERQSLAGLMDELAGADLVIGVDSGLSHLAAALAVPTLVLYGSTSSALTGCRGPRVRNLDARFPCAPCLTRDCRYTGPDQRWQGEVVEPACYASLPPERVWQAATELVYADRVLHL